MKRNAFIKFRDALLVCIVCVILCLTALIKLGRIQTNCYRDVTKTIDSDDNTSDAVFLRTSTMQGSVNTKNDDAPLMLLHVGPRKTGTTTVQWFAGEYLDRLKQDNFYFLGQNPDIPGMRLHMLHKKCAKITKPEQEQACAKEWGHFKRTLESHYEQGHNVIVSEELFNSFHDPEDAERHLWSNLMPLLENWNVRVVITHRRYYEWVPSKYFQMYNPGAGPSNDAKRANWPDRGGLTIPSFPDYFEGVNRATHKHPTAMKKKWDLRFDNVQVFNMHNGEEFVNSFFCTMLPEATKLCNFLTTEYKSTVKNSKSSKVIHYDMLAVAAYKKGLLPRDGSLSRYDVTRAVESKSLELGLESQKDFPLKCLTQEQADKLLHLSMTFESEMIPDFFGTERGEPELKEEFKKASDVGMYCSIDVEKVLDEPRWKEFFKNLGEQKTNQ